MSLENSGGRYEALQPAEVLLVEDNFADVILTRESFKSGEILVNLHHVENGEECMAFLRKEGRYAAAPTPDVILLDLNMPRMDGHEVLGAMAADERLRHIPVLTLAASRGDQEVPGAYALRCSFSIVKPVDYEKFQEAIRQIGGYGFALVRLPGSRR